MSNTHSYDFCSHFAASPSSDLDYYSQIQLYSCSLDKKTNLKSYKRIIEKSEYEPDLPRSRQLLNNLNLCQPTVNINLLPVNSFFVQFEFKLKKPFYSKDDEQFYIIDYPISKESVFKVPMVRPSGWAGALKNAVIKISDEEKYKNSVDRLFGYVSDKENDNKKGFLMLFPTYFDNIKFEIINPHDRETKAGKNPIFYEVVPAKSTGSFSLLYVPFYVSDDEKPHDNENMAFDINLISKGLKDMFLIHGFGAKTSSGFGIVEDKLIDGKITLKTKSITVSVQEDIMPPEKLFEKYLYENGNVKDIFIGGGEDGLLSNKEYNYKASQFKDGSLNEFKKFRTWYKYHACDWQKHLQSKNETSTEWPFWTFDTFDGLINVAKDIKQKLLNSEEEGQ